MKNINVISWKDNLLDISSLDQFKPFLLSLFNIHEIVSKLGDYASFHTQILVSEIKIHELNSEFFSSIDNTLKSVYMCSKMANFSDATVLLRKYRDDLFQWLFIVESISDIEKSKLFENMEQNDVYCKEENDIQELYLALTKWFNSSIDINDKKTIKLKYFDAEIYRKSLCRQSLLNACFDQFLDPIWINLNDRLNDYAHINGFKFIHANNAANNYEIAYFNEKLNELGDILLQITSCFLCFLILTKPFYLSSRDFIDSLERNVEPPINSQFWISPIFRNFIETNIFSKNIGLKAFLVNNIPFGMKID